MYMDICHKSKGSLEVSWAGSRIQMHCFCPDLDQVFKFLRNHIQIRLSTWILDPDPRQKRRVQKVLSSFLLRET